MKGKAISIATYNTFGIPLVSPDLRERYSVISNYLNQQEIDVINFQEVFTYGALKLLVGSMPAFPYNVYKPSLLGPKGGLVTFSKICMERNSYHSLSTIDAPFLKKVGEFVKNKGIDKGVLISDIDCLRLRILNVHLSANKDNDWSPSNRFYQIHSSELEKLAKLVRANRQERTTLLVAGDFNIAKSSDLYWKYIEMTKLQDSFETDDSPTFHSEFLPSGDKPHRIDYIFVDSNGKNIQIENTENLFKDKAKFKNGRESYLSDHIALVAQVKFTD